jgi:hypothetical protein
MKKLCYSTRERGNKRLTDHHIFIIIAPGFSISDEERGVSKHSADASSATWRRKSRGKIIET